MAEHAQVREDLALYMLGELEPARAAEFRAHIESCAECQRELQQMQADAAAYAMSAAGPAPPARARERLIRALEAERHQTARAPSTAARRSSLAYWIPSFAALAFAFLAIFLWVKSSKLERSLASYAQQNRQQRAAIEKQQALWHAFNSRDAVHMTLTSSSKPQPQGRVIYVPKRGAVLFFANYFAPAPQHKAYQLWLLPASGQAPMSCGTFKPDAGGAASFTVEGMPENIEAKTFAITMEPEAGSQTPTMPILMSAKGS